MNTQEVIELAQRIREVIPPEDRIGALRHHHHAHRRLAEYVNGLHEHLQIGEPGQTQCAVDGRWEWCNDGRRYEALLRRLAREYGARQ